MTVFDLLRLLYLCCLAATCVVGLRDGGRDEKAGVVIVMAASLLTIAVQHPALFDWRTDRIALVGVDLLVLLAFFYLAMKSRRFWPLWATAFHLIAVCSHLVMFLEPHRILQAYALLQGFWAYPILASIVLGACGPRAFPARRATLRSR